LELNAWDLAKLAEFSKTQRVKKDVCKTKWFNIVLVCLESGQEIPSRSEPYEVCFYVVDGRGTFTIGNEQVDLSRGSMVLAPANVARGIRSKERLTLLGIQEPH
jgi:quercetin dioxygenase-like cupin family protein